MRSILGMFLAIIAGVLLALGFISVFGAPAEADAVPLQVTLLVNEPQEAILAAESWHGVASWYGPGFHGRITANGETYDMHGLTAAHKTLPLGSVVRVVNPRNGRSLIVRINDRGPFIDHREIDVSFEVARQLGFEEKGLARVRIDLLEVPQRRTPTTQSGD